MVIWTKSIFYSIVSLPMVKTSAFAGSCSASLEMLFPFMYFFWFVFVIQFFWGKNICNPDYYSQQSEVCLVGILKVFVQM